jgi:acyl carrier protein
MNDDRSFVRESIRTHILSAFLDGADPSALGDDVSLERSHIVDSVKTLDLILYLEDTFGFCVENDEAVPANFDTVDNLVDYVMRKRRESACA